MTDTMDRTRSDVDAAGVVTVGQDIGCFRCGYNVRGLAGDGQCPECAAPIDETLRLHAAHVAGMLPLEASDPRWVRTLAWACGLLFASGIARIATQIGSMTPVGVPRVAGMVLYLAPFVLLAAGGLMLAAREPTDAGRRRLWLRVLIRVALVAWLAVLTWLIYVIMARQFGALRQPIIANDVVSAVASWGCFWRLREVAARAGRTWLRRACASLAFLAALTCLALIVPGVADIQTGTAAYHMMVPEPILAAGMLVVLLPYSLAVVPRFDVGVVVHIAMTLVTVAAIVTTGLLWWAVRAAAKRSRDGATRMTS
jgi:hypothetical protein